MSPDTIKKLEAKVKELSARLDTTERSLKEDLGSADGGFEDIFTSISKRTSAIEESMKSLSTMGATFAKGGPLALGLADTAFELDKLLGNSKLGTRAFTEMVGKVEQFGNMSTLASKGAKDLAKDLATQAALLDRVGVSYGDFAKNIDSAIFSFGQSAEEVKTLNLELKGFADSVNMLPSVISRNFQTVSKNLAYDFGMIKQQFAGIQKLSAETGVSVDTLMGKFGQPMDTISGASEMAARMNALLGRNEFSATQLMMMSEKDRMETFKTILSTDSNIQGSISAGGAEGKFALQTVAAALGMSVDNARRFMSGGDLKDELSKKSGRSFDAEGKKLVNSNMSLEEAIKNLNDTIRRQQMDPRARTLIAARQENMFDGDKLSNKVSLQMLGGMLADLGVAPGEVPMEDLVKIIQNDPSTARSLIEFTKLTKSGVFQEKEFQTMIGNLQSGKAGVKQLQAKVENTNITGKNINAVEAELIKRAIGSGIPGFAEEVIKQARQSGAKGKDNLNEIKFGEIKEAQETANNSARANAGFTPNIPKKVANARRGTLPADQAQGGIQSIIVKVGDTTFAKLVFDAAKGLFEPVVPPP